MHRLKHPEEKPISFVPINHGMPPLDMEGKSVSWFEFLPRIFFYSPVALQWIWLGIKYRNWCLPLIANPGIALSGMVGESKHAIFSVLGKKARAKVLPYIMWQKNEASSDIQTQCAITKLTQKGLTFPLVAKPDIGCRGAGVRLVENETQLEQYLQLFPQNAQMMLQKKAPYCAEAGVFYVRYPGQARGNIISITLKYKPFVIGDGQRTLAELINDDPRARKLRHLYYRRHKEKLDFIVKPGEAFRLAFAGSHCCGAIFRNGNEYITDALVSSFDRFFDDFPGFHFGRVDLKFKNIDSLMRGQDFFLIEINGASSEAAHIWDRNTTLKEAFSTLFNQYRILFEMGAIQRNAGMKVPTLRDLLRAWKKEKALVKHYPSTD